MPHEIFNIAKQQVMNEPGGRARICIKLAARAIFELVTK